MLKEIFYLNKYLCPRYMNYLKNEFCHFRYFLPQPGPGPKNTSTEPFLKSMSLPRTVFSYWITGDFASIIWNWNGIELLWRTHMQMCIVFVTNNVYELWKRSSVVNLLVANMLMFPLQLYVISLDRRECLSNPCLNEGTCIEQVNGYQCRCMPGYTGTRCETSKYRNLKYNW